MPEKRTSERARRNINGFLFGWAIVASGSAIAAGTFNSNHPEEAYPDNMPRMISPGPYDEFIKQVQQKLHEAGFDAGPINGDFGTKTQTALGQFQLSRVLPASGMLDDQTLAELDVQRPTQQSGGDQVATQNDAGTGQGEDKATSGAGGTASAKE